MFGDYWREWLLWQGCNSCLRAKHKWIYLRNSGRTYKEKYYRPTIILTNSSTEGLAKGSGRSIETYNIYKEVLKFKENLESFGGHPMACGLSININNIDDLRNFLNNNSTLTKAQKQKQLILIRQLIFQNYH